MLRFLVVFTLLLSFLPGCPQKRLPPPPPDEEESSLPPTPKVDLAFIQKALGVDLSLANKALVADIDQRPGLEALVAVHHAGGSYEVAVVRGDHVVLARAPLGGKILAGANIQAIGEFRPMDLWGDGSKTYLMPVETLVYHQAVCGVLAFRYRYNSLSLVGEFASRCWRGGQGGDPFRDFKVNRDGKQLTIATVEERGKRLYRWDESQQAFLTSEPLPGK